MFIVYNKDTDSYLTAYQLEPDIRFAWSKNREKAKKYTKDHMREIKEHLDDEIDVEFILVQNHQEIDMRGVSFG